MSNLRAISADGPPSAAPAEFFGRLPETVMRDPELSDGAKLAYAALTLLQARAQHPTHCTEPMREIGRAMGTAEREARYRVAELEARGHVVRERLYTIAGAPAAIRPLRTTRSGASTRHKRADCNRHDPAGPPAQPCRPPGTPLPTARHADAGSLKRETEEEGKQQQTAASAEPVVVASSAPPGRPDFLRSLAMDLAQALSPDAAAATPAAAPTAATAGDQKPKRAKKRPGSATTLDPGATGTSEPKPARSDSSHSTDNSDCLSRGENSTEHKSD